MAYLGGTSLRTLEAANLFCGSTGASQHLRLANVKLPAWEEVYLDHHAGGAPVAIEVDVQMEKLDCEFSLAGWTPEVDSLLAAWQAGENQFTFYGAIRDRVLVDPSKSVVQAVVTMTGRLGQVQPTQWSRGQLQHYNYAIRSIIAYEATIAGRNLIKWDFFNNQFIVGSDTPVTVT